MKYLDEYRDPDVDLVPPQVDQGRKAGRGEDRRQRAGDGYVHVDPEAEAEDRDHEEAATYADQRAELTKQLRDWQKKTGDALSNRENAEKLFDMIRAAGLNREKLPYAKFMDTQTWEDEE